MREWDTPLLVVTLVLCAVGVIMVHSATAGRETGSRDLGLDHLVRVLLGLGLMLSVRWISIRSLKLLALPAYVGSVLLLAAVLVVGRTHGGATRWLGVGPVEIQPSELAKVATILVLGLFFSEARGAPTWRHMAVAGVLAGIPFALTVAEPDLGSALVYPSVAVGMAWWAGVPFVSLFSVVVPAISPVCSFSLFAWSALMVTIVGVLWWVRAGFWRFFLVCGAAVAGGLVTPHVWEMLEDYQKTRILVFVNPGLDPRGSGWNAIQSRIAIGSGRVWGKGLMKGTQKALAFLPAQHTDFIFSVIGEELGYVGSQLILILFGILLWRGIAIASRCRSRFAGLVAIGICLVVGTQVVVNVGMNAGLLPITGIPLPFISYGGTHVVVSLGMVGLLQSFKKNWKETS